MRHAPAATSRVLSLLAAGFLALVLAGCGGAEPAEPSATPTKTQEPTETPTATPTEEPAPEGTVAGDWCPTPESGDTRCLTVALPTVTYDDGTSAEIVGEGFEIGDGGTQYSFSDAPFGDFYPAGSPIELPDYYPGGDVPDQDRIWNSQTSVLLVRATSSSGGDFPDELQGEWSAKDGSEHFSEDELLSANPGAFVMDAAESEDVPGATDFTICLTADSGAGECSTAASMFLRYFPKGTEWDCAKAGKEGKLPYDFTSCDPDFTAAHDSSKPRLIVLPNHQHNQDYVDSVPMYQKRD